MTFVFFSDHCVSVVIVFLFAKYPGTKGYSGPVPGTSATRKCSISILLVLAAGTDETLGVTSDRNQRQPRAVSATPLGSFAILAFRASFVCGRLEY